jgi:hypothetical protein
MRTKTFHNLALAILAIITAVTIMYSFSTFGAVNSYRNDDVMTATQTDATATEKSDEKEMVTTKTIEEKTEKQNSQLSWIELYNKYQSKVNIELPKLNDYEDDIVPTDKTALNSDENAIIVTDGVHSDNNNSKVPSQQTNVDGTTEDNSSQLAPIISCTIVACAVIIFTIVVGSLIVNHRK